MRIPIRVIPYLLFLVLFTEFASEFLDLNQRGQNALFWLTLSAMIAVNAYRYLRQSSKEAEAGKQYKAFCLRVLTQPVQETKDYIERDPVGTGYFRSLPLLSQETALANLRLREKLANGQIAPEKRALGEELLANALREAQA